MYMYSHDQNYMEKYVQAYPKTFKYNGKLKMMQAIFEVQVCYIFLKKITYNIRELVLTQKGHNNIWYCYDIH